MLAYPAAYLAMTLVAGAYGEGYPYDFLDVSRIGLGAVLLVSLAFPRLVPGTRRAGHGPGKARPAQVAA